MTPDETARDPLAPADGFVALTSGPAHHRPPAPLPVDALDDEVSRALAARRIAPARRRDAAARPRESSCVEGAQARGRGARQRSRWDVRGGGDARPSAGKRRRADRGRPNGPPGNPGDDAPPEAPGIERGRRRSDAAIDRLGATRRGPARRPRPRWGSRGDSAGRRGVGARVQALLTESPRRGTRALGQPRAGGSAEGDALPCHGGAMLRSGGLRADACDPNCAREVGRGGRRASGSTVRADVRACQDL